MCFSVEVEKDLKKLSQRFKAQIDHQAFDQLDKNHLLFPKRFKSFDKNNRIFPNYYAPVVISQSELGGKKILPMRYRLRPAGSLQEVPGKYNLFNARLDSLEKRPTWKNIFMNNHALFPFRSFFEWVEDSKVKGKKVLINFKPQKMDLMWAPSLWDRWISADGKEEINSFALITTDPPAEILEQGHDRCPIFLKEEFIDDWLNPQGKKIDHFYQILQHPLKVHYQWNWVNNN